MERYRLSIAVECIGIAVVLLGIIVEVVEKANAGFIAISVGSVLVAIGSLIWTKVLKKG